VVISAGLFGDAVELVLSLDFSECFTLDTGAGVGAGLGSPALCCLVALCVDCAGTFWGMGFGILRG